MKWTKEALVAIERVPEFVREMAKKVIENEVYSSGRDEVSV